MAVVVVGVFELVASVSAGKKATFSLVGVGGTIATGGGGVRGVLNGFCALEGAFSVGFLSVVVFCFRRSALLN